MSAFLIPCPNCGIELEVDEQSIGRNAVCSICQYRFVIQDQNTEQVNSNIEPNIQAPNYDESPGVSKTEQEESCLGNSDLKFENKDNVFKDQHKNIIDKIRPENFCYRPLKIFFFIGLIINGCFWLLGFTSDWLQEMLGNTGIYTIGILCIFSGCIFIRTRGVPDKKSKEYKYDGVDTEKDLTTGTPPSSQDRIIPGEKAISDIIEPEISPRSRLAALLREIADQTAEEETLEEDDFENEAELSAKYKNENSFSEKIPESVIEKKERIVAALPEYTLPPVSILSKGNDDIGESPETIQQNVLTIQRTLDSFGVSGKVVGHTIGPRTTRYEISLANGVNINKFMRLENTFAMKLGVSKISLLSSLPRTDCVGIEIPNTHPQTVFMRNVMETKQWKKSEAVIPVVIGENFSNEPVVIDLAQAPHLLIAGSTGSGKSVCLDTLIISLLFEFSPDELQLIMFDPNLIDFVNYSRLPHLVTPVINDAQKVPDALRWAVTEMENRYKNLARAGVKKLTEFNALSKDGTPIRGNDGQIIADNFGNPVTRMPLLIIIINEFAEMYNHGFWIDAETYIDRITKLGRAAGVHIVMATQRPSADIISGKIKANFPARIAFRVPQNIDSRVILDQPGAEKLFGGGDMLAKLPGVSGLERIQGALVEDRDITAVTKFVSDQRPQNFAKGIVDDEEISDKDEFNSFSDYESIDDDDIFDDMDKAEIAPLIKKYMQPGDDETMRRALEVVILERKASTSYIQRRLKIGYNSAAELIDIMEERGIISPPSGSGNKRGILIFDGIEINE